jgi:N-acetylglucosaminyldiphosphoundecaprenol N-acetyl-beta-D-mannosaminyltransferase
MSNEQTSILEEDILGFSVATQSFAEQIALMMQWAQQRLSRVVCVANVHMLPAP